MTETPKALARSRARPRDLVLTGILALAVLAGAETAKACCTRGQQREGQHAGEYDQRLDKR